MVSCKAVEMLHLLNRVCVDSTFDYVNDLKLLNLENQKKPVIFCVKVANRRFMMNGWEGCFKKNGFFVGLKYHQFAEMLEFCKQIDIIAVQIIISKARCSNKWFNHSDFKSLRIYPYCYPYTPLLAYNCYIGNDVQIKKNEG